MFELAIKDNPNFGLSDIEINRGESLTQWIQSLTTENIS